MKFLYVAVVFMAFFALTMAEDCKVGADKIIKKGETYQPPGKCQLMTCGEKGALSAKICPPLPPNVKKCKVIEEDGSKAWPACCGSLKC